MNKVQTISAGLYDYDPHGFKMHDKYLMFGKRNNGIGEVHVYENKDGNWSKVKVFSFPEHQEKYSGDILQMNGNVMALTTEGKNYSVILPEW